MLSHFFSFFDISVDVPFNPRLRFLPPLPKQFMSAEEALAPTRRHQHILPDGRVAYEWSQSLSDVTVFVPCPQGVRGRDLDVCIERERCRLGLKGNPPYLDVSAAFSSRMERKETALYPALVSGKDQRGGTEERRRAGGAKRFFCFFPVLLLLRRRAIEEIDNGKIAHALSTCFLHLHSTPKSQHATFSVVKASESFWTLGEEAGSIG